MSTSDGHATIMAGTAMKRESSSDTAAVMAAEVLVAASKRRRSDFRAAAAVDRRQSEDARTSPSAADVEADMLLSNGKGDVTAPLTAQRKRQRGSASSKEVQLLASKVVVTPGKARIRRSAADQAWWVVK